MKTTLSKLKRVIVAGFAFGFLATATGSTVPFARNSFNDKTLATRSPVKERAVTTALGVMTASLAPIGSVDFGTNLQRIDGVGAAFAFQRAAVIHGLFGLTPQHQQEVADLLFNPQTGAGFSIVRLGLGSGLTSEPYDHMHSIQPTNPGGPNAPPQYVWNHDDDGQVWIAQQAQAYGVRRFYAEPWSAPRYMKRNNSDIGGSTTQTLCGLPGSPCTSGDWRQAYANYLVQYINFYQQEGIQITELGFVNEPDLAVSYASMVVSSSQAIDFIKVLGPTVAASGLPVKIVCCDHSRWSGAITYTNAIQADPVASQYVSTYSGHEYGSAARSPLPAGNKTTWMSEWGQSGTTWNEAWDGGGSSASSDGILLANDVSDTFTQSKVNAYITWVPVSIGATKAMIQADGADYHVSKRFYAMAAYSRYIRPGAFMVPSNSTNSSVKVSAFRNADGVKVINIINNATTSVSADFNVDAATANASDKYYLTSYLTDTTHSLSAVGVAQLNGQTLSVGLAPRSLTTVLLSPDTTMPTLTLPPDQTVEATGPDGALVTFSGSAHDDLSGDVPVSFSQSSGSTFPLGTTTVTATATDAAGNSSSGSFTITVHDTTAPTLTLPANQTLEATGPDGAVASFSASAQDIVGGDVGVSFSQPSGSTFSLGTTTITVSAMDAAGNTSSGSFTVTVQDTTAPVITLPASQTLEATSPDGALATFSASAQDIVGGDVPVSFTTASGSVFPLGTTTVTTTATDAAGNIATGSFTVTVQDTTAPLLTLPASQTLEATSAAGAVASFSASSLDIVGGNVPVSFSIPSGSTFPLGTTTVTATATDAAGNVATGSFTVTVRDTTAPALTLPSNQTLEATGPDGAVAIFSALAQDIVSGNVPVSFSIASGSVFPLGTTTVSAITMDAAGNNSSGSFTITVHDTTAPMIQSLTASPNVLWPANHKMVAVNISAAVTDASDPAPTIRIIAVSSNEPVNVNAAPDWEVTGNLTLNLRAERTGGGSGRVYTITVESLDAAGNASVRTVTVSVPHNQ
jgi:glucosylceramidase